MDQPEQTFVLRKLKIEVSYRCHLRCLHCSSSAGEPGCVTMPWEDFRRVATEAIDMGVGELALSGGEPLLWPHTREAVALAADRDVRTCLYTSGSTRGAGRALEELKRNGLHRAIFSLLGGSASTHDAVTSVAGSFQCTLTAMRDAAEAGLVVEVHFVPLAANLAELPVAASTARRNGATRVSVLRFVPQGRGSGNGQLALSRKQNMELRSVILGLRDEEHHIRVGSPYNFLTLAEAVPCSSGVNGLTILPDLRIVPCDAFKGIPPESLGLDTSLSDVSTHSLADCWSHSPYLGMVREAQAKPLGETCNRCLSLDRCQSGCMAQKFHASRTLHGLRDPMCLGPRSSS